MRFYLAKLLLVLALDTRDTRASDWNATTPVLFLFPGGLIDLLQGALKNLFKSLPGGEPGDGPAPEALVRDRVRLKGLLKRLSEAPPTSVEGSVDLAFTTTSTVLLKSHLKRSLVFL